MADSGVYLKPEWFPPADEIESASTRIVLNHANEHISKAIVWTSELASRLKKSTENSLIEYHGSLHILQQLTNAYISIGNLEFVVNTSQDPEMAIDGKSSNVMPK